MFMPEKHNTCFLTKTRLPPKFVPNSGLPRTPSLFGPCHLQQQPSAGARRDLRGFEIVQEREGSDRLPREKFTERHWLRPQPAIDDDIAVLCLLLCHTVLQPVAAPLAASL